MGTAEVRTRTPVSWTSVPWMVVIVLGVLGLIRPIMSMTGLLDALGKPWSPLAVTALLAVVWIGAVVVLRVANPILTLALAGLAYAVAAVVLNVIGTLTMGGQLIPVYGIVSMSVFNVLLGGFYGVLALGIGALLRRRG